MSEVKWIKITTDIFDDEKILMIECLPEADSIIVIWFKLLCLAGKTNNSGVFMFNEKMAYTEKMLSTVFRRKESTVKLALETFEKFGMIEIIDDVITIPNWGKHQNLDQLENKREYMKNYMADYRQKQKEIVCKTNSKTNSKTNVSSLDKNREDKNREDKNRIDKTREDKRDISSDSDESGSTHTQKHKYGEYMNVLLTDEELEKLQNEFPDYEERIDRLSDYIASKGTKYKSHYATIRNWARRDREQQISKPQQKNKVAQDLDNFYSMVADWAQEEGDNEG